jgi:F0F1-type ATP synthase membrane subunit b/b'
MEALDQRCVQLIKEAEGKGMDIIEQSRHAAREAARVIEDKARKEAKISLENALREIREESQKAQMRLKEESAHIAVRLAEKIIEENLTDDRSTKLIDRLIKKL